MKRKYFIDTENVGDAWISFLKKAEPDDAFILFISKYTKLSHGNMRKIMDSGKTGQISFHEVYTQGKGGNAMDYTLCSSMLESIYLDPESEFVILSSDHDYDVFLSEQVERGIHASRISFVPEFEEISYAAATEDADADAILPTVPSPAASSPTLKPAVSAKQIRKLLKKELEDGYYKRLTSSFDIQAFCQAIIACQGDVSKAINKLESGSGKNNLLSCLVSKKVRKKIEVLF